MKDDGLLEAWRLAAIGLYTLFCTPIAAIYAALRGALTPAPPAPRVTCGNCGYRMVELERHCPECRNMVR